MMKIGFFGCGNMGSSLALGFKEKNPNIDLYFFTPSKDKAKKLANKTQGHFVEHIVDMPKDLDWYVLAFKPQSLGEFFYEFSPDAKVLSVLAGTSIETLTKKIKTNRIIRLMPNTPSKIGAGANLYFSYFLYPEMQELLSSLGALYIMKDEGELDVITSFSGSGPALIFEYARLFEKHLISMSGGNKLSREIIAETFLGSAKLMSEAIKNGESFESLRDQVTSKKGVTFEALSILEKNKLDQIMGGAFLAAHKRTLELKKGI